MGEIEDDVFDLAKRLDDAVDLAKRLDDSVELAKQLDNAKRALTVERETVRGYIETNKLLNDKINCLTTQLELKIFNEESLRVQVKNLLTTNVNNSSNIIQSLLKNTKEEFSEFKNELFHILDEEKTELVNDKKEFDRLIDLISQKMQTLGKEFVISNSVCAELRDCLAQKPNEMSDRENLVKDEQNGETLEEMSAKIKENNSKLDEMQKECEKWERENILEKERTKRRFQQYRSANFTIKQLNIKIAYLKKGASDFDFEGRKAIDLLNKELIAKINAQNLIPIDLNMPQEENSLIINLGSFDGF